MEVKAIYRCEISSEPLTCFCFISFNRIQRHFIKIPRVLFRQMSLRIATVFSPELIALQTNLLSENEPVGHFLFFSLFFYAKLHINMNMHQFRLFCFVFVSFIFFYFISIFSILFVQTSDWYEYAPIYSILICLCHIFHFVFSYFLFPFLTPRYYLAEKVLFRKSFPCLGYRFCLFSF